MKSVGEMETGEIITRKNFFEFVRYFTDGSSLLYLVL